MDYTKQIESLEVGQNLVIYTKCINSSSAQDGMRLYIARVPGGWIYETIAHNTVSTVFVPVGELFT